MLGLSAVFCAGFAVSHFTSKLTYMYMQGFIQVWGGGGGGGTFEQRNLWNNDCTEKESGAMYCPLCTCTCTCF